MESTNLWGLGVMVARYKTDILPRIQTATLFNFHYEGKGPGSNPGGSTNFNSREDAGYPRSLISSRLDSSILSPASSLRMLTATSFMTRWFDSNFFLMEKSLNGRATA